MRTNETRTRDLKNTRAEKYTEDPEVRRRFLTTEQVAEELNVGLPLVRSLLKTGELRGIQIGGRGLWRIAATDLEDYITQAYRTTAGKIEVGEFLDEDPKP